MGTPTEETWPGVSSLPDYKPTFPKWKKNTLGDKCVDKKGRALLAGDGLNLLEVN